MRLILLVSFLQSLLLVSAGGAFGQSRQTICLQDAESGICKETLGKFDERKTRISQIGNERLRSVCMALVQQRFFRDCANQFVARPRHNIACYRIFKAHERTARASTAKLRAQTRVYTSRCE